MRKVVEVTTCDICNKEKPVTEIEYPVLFHTEQTEGRTVTPYISKQKLDVCSDCKPKLLVVHGWGAQGYNEYKLTEDNGDASRFVPLSSSPYKRDVQRLAELLRTLDMSGYDSHVHGDYDENVAEYLISEGVTFADNEPEKKIAFVESLKKMLEEKRGCQLSDIAIVELLEEALNQ